MERIILVLASFVIAVSAACASKPETQQKVESTKEETAGDEGSTRYRRLEGSDAYSSEEAAAQIGGY